MIAVLAALRRVRDRDGAIRVLAGIALGAALAAWIGSQIEPAWANRYFAVFLGPLVLALAAVLARGSRLTAVALVGVVAIWLFNAPIAERSNVRTVAAEVTPVIRPGDVVASTQPEQVPVLSRYLPSGVLYVTPLGMVFDERVTDWRNGVERMRAGKPRPRPDAAAGAARPGPADPARDPDPEPAAVEGAVEARDPRPHARVARRAAPRPAPARDRGAAHAGRSSTCAARCGPRSSRSSERQRANSAEVGSSSRGPSADTDA